MSFKKDFSMADDNPPHFFGKKKKGKRRKKRKSFKTETIKRCHQCQNVAVLRASRIQNF